MWRAGYTLGGSMQLFVALAIFDGVPRDFLDDPAALRAALESAVTRGEFTLHQSVVVKFQPQGVTACAVVGESHLALHTWPEEGRLFFDVATCGPRQGTRAAIDAILAALPAGRLAVLDERVIDPSGARSAGS
jgi:S-adenosylmethionine decarboxylase